MTSREPRKENQTWFQYITRRLPHSHLLKLHLGASITTNLQLSQTLESPNSILSYGMQLSDEDGLLCSSYDTNLKIQKEFLSLEPKDAHGGIYVELDNSNLAVVDTKNVWTDSKGHYEWTGDTLLESLTDHRKMPSQEIVDRILDEILTDEWIKEL